MHSPDLVSSRLQTQFEYPRQQRSKNALYICVSLSFSTMKGLFFPRHVSQGQSGMFVYHKSRKRKKADLVYGKWDEDRSKRPLRSISLSELLK